MYPFIDIDCLTTFCNCSLCDSIGQCIVAVLYRKQSIQVQCKIAATILSTIPASSVGLDHQVESLHVPYGTVPKHDGLRHQKNIKTMAVSTYKQNWGPVSFGLQAAPRDVNPPGSLRAKTVANNTGI